MLKFYNLEARFVFSRVAENLSTYLIFSNCYPIFYHLSHIANSIISNGN